MIVRPFTFLTGVLFALSGAYLFVVKHQSQALEDHLEQVAESSRQDEQAIRVLQAQWALEADPSRIGSLAAQFTGLQPMKPGQLVTLASLSSSLPAPGSPAPFSNPQDEIPAIPSSGNAPAVPSGPAIEVRGHVATAEQAGKTAVAVKPAPPSEQLADNAAPSAIISQHRPAHPHVTEHHASERVASAETAFHVPEGLVHQAAAHQAVAHPAHSSSALYEASVSAIAPAVPTAHQARALPMGAQVVRVRATAALAPAPSQAPPAAPLGGGSLLGMAQTGSQN